MLHRIHKVGHGSVTGFVSNLEILDEQIGKSDDAMYIFPEHQTKADNPKKDSAQSKIHKVFHDDIAGIFGTGKSCFHHGKTRLHEKYQKSTDQNPNRIY